jgi:hypothetical protein
MRAMHELHSNIKYSVALAPLATAIADTSAQTTVIIDMQGYESLEFIVITGILADVDATFAVTMTHGDAVDSVTAPTTITDSGAVPAECILGSLSAASFDFSADAAVRSVGYTPHKGAGKRWVRLTITPAANTGAAPLAVLAARLPTQFPAQ